MKESDLVDVLSIECEAYGEHHWSIDGFRNEIKNDVARYICAKIQNEDGSFELIGYMGIWTVFEEAHITTLAVREKYRNSQIAQILLISQIEYLYKNMVKYLTLEVRESNQKAINLYEKYGFKSLGKRKNYYQNNNEDALIMWTNNIFSTEYKKMFEETKSKISKEIIYE